MSRLYIASGGNYVNVPDGNRIKFSNGSGYVDASEARVWNGSSYSRFYSRSDPISVTFYPTFTTSLRWSGSAVQYDGAGTAADDTHADMFVGRFGGSFPYHYTSLLKFTGPSVEGFGTITDIIQTRPVIKGSALRLYRAAGGWYSPVGFLRIGTWTQPFMETLPATTLNGTYHDWDPHTANDIYGWLHGQNRWFPVWSQNIWDLAFGNSLMISEVLSGYTTPGGTSGTYSRITGATTIDPNIFPILAVTFDVV